MNVLEFKDLLIVQHPNMLYAVHKGNESLVLDAKCLNNIPTLKGCNSPQYFWKLPENCPKVTNM